VSLAAGDDGLTPRQEAAIVALLSQKTVKAAAKKAGVPEPTLWDWLREPKFKARYSLLKRCLSEQALSEIADELRANGKEAVKALKRNLNVRGHPGVQVRAAIAILDKLIVWQEAKELRADLAEMKALLSAEHSDGLGNGTNSGDAGPGGSNPPDKPREQPDPRPPSNESGAPVRSDGVGGGPVADGVPEQSGEEGIPPLFP
jgi:transposase-like protein